MLPVPRSILLLASLLLAGLAQAQDYEIRLNRPTAVGNRYRLTSTASDEQSANAKVDGQPARSQRELIAAELIADVEVLAVTPKGRESKVSLTIEKFTRTDPQGGELLPPGSTVVAEYAGGKTTFAVGGAPAARNVARAFEVAGITMHDDNKPGDDDIFGTAGRKKVGDTWEINTALAVAELAKTGVKVEAVKPNGSATVAELTKANGLPVVRIDATLAMDGIAPPLPPGVTIQKSAFKATFSGLFPTDLTKPRQQESQTLDLQIEASGDRDGRLVEMSMVKKTSRETKMTYQ
jgi:hypothetical protein